MAANTTAQVNRIARAATKGTEATRRLTLEQSRDVFDRVFFEVVTELQRQRRVIVPGFGIFRVRVRKARTTRHPKTREPIALPAQVEVRFSVSPIAKAGRR